MMAVKFTVGQRIWQFDINRRVYERDAEGFAKGGPIYEAHFLPMKVLRIESNRYIVATWPEGGYERRVSFLAVTAERGNWVDDAEKERRIWEHVHRHSIIRMVERADVDTLRKVAAAIGYESTAKKETA